MFCSPTRQHRNGREKNHEIRQAQHGGSHHRPQNDLQRLENEFDQGPEVRKVRGFVTGRG
jgi:hypothetical protein